MPSHRCEGIFLRAKRGTRTGASAGLFPRHMEIHFRCVAEQDRKQTKSAMRVLSARTLSELCSRSSREERFSTVLPLVILVDNYIEKQYTYCAVQPGR